MRDTKTNSLINKRNYEYVKDAAAAVAFKPDDGPGIQEAAGRSEPIASVASGKRQKHTRQFIKHDVNATVVAVEQPY